MHESIENVHQCTVTFPLSAWNAEMQGTKYAPHFEGPVTLHVKDSCMQVYQVRT